MSQKPKWGIVGGGIMGMTLAFRLSQQGYDVDIFEAAPDLGGLTSAWKIGDYTWDKFYHVILPDDTYTLGILKEIGLESKVKWVETKTGFYVDGKFYSMSDTMEFLKFPPLNLIDKFRLGLTIMVGSYSTNWKKLEQIPVTKWLLRWSGKRTFNKIWLPLLKAKLGYQYKDTSAAFICATIQRLYKARKKGSKKEVFGYVEGGYANILESFKNKLVEQKIGLNTGYKVQNIEQENNGNITIKFHNQEPKSYDRVIVTLPSTIAASVCNGLTSDEINKLKGIDYLGVICTSVLLKKPLTPYYVTNITDTELPFTGIIEMTALVDKKNFGGNSLVYLPKYVSASDPLFDASEEEVKDYFLESLNKMHPDLTADDILVSSLARARQVIALPVMGYLQKLHGFTTSIPNLFIVNSALITDGTLNVNETVKIAETRLEQILK